MKKIENHHWSHTVKNSVKIHQWMLKREQSFKKKRIIFTVSNDLSQTTYLFITKGNTKFTVENLGWHPPSLGSRLVSPVVRQIDITDPLTWCTKEDPSPRWYSSPNAQAQSNHEKTSDRPSLKDILLSTWSALFKSVKVLEAKKRQKNFHRLEETKET